MPGTRVDPNLSVLVLVHVLTKGRGSRGYHGSEHGYEYLTASSNRMHVAISD